MSIPKSMLAVLLAFILAFYGIPATALAASEDGGESQSQSQGNGQESFDAQPDSSSGDVETGEIAGVELMAAALTPQDLTAQASNGKIRFVSGMPSLANDKADNYLTVVYSDEYFAKNSSEYNTDLAYASTCLAGATMNSNLYGTDYSRKAVNIRSFLQDVGCNDIKVNEGYTSRPTEKSNIGVAVGCKDINVNNTKYKLFVVGIRGGNYEGEWAGNVRVGASGDHQGFAEARDSVLGFVLPYIVEHTASGDNVKIWISGYSRSAATANLVGGWLSTWLKTGSKEIKGKTPTVTYAKNYDAKLMRNTESASYDLSGRRMDANDVYCYPVNAPLGGEKSVVDANNKYCVGVHNLINPDDWIPQVAPAWWGFARYGTDHDITGTYKEGESFVDRPKVVYDGKTTTMLSRLAKIESQAKFTFTGYSFRQYMFSKMVMAAYLAAPAATVAVQAGRKAYNWAEAKVKSWWTKKKVVDTANYTPIIFDDAGEGNMFISKKKELVNNQGRYYTEFMRFFADAIGATDRTQYTNKYQKNLEFLMGVFMGMNAQQKAKFNAALRENISTAVRGIGGKKVNVIRKLISDLVGRNGAVGLITLDTCLMLILDPSATVSMNTTSALTKSYNAAGIHVDAATVATTTNALMNIASGVYNSEQKIGKLNFYHLITLAKAVGSIGQAHWPEVAAAWQSKCEPGNAASFKGKSLGTQALTAQGDEGASAQDEKTHWVTVRVDGGNAGTFERQTGEVIGTLPISDDVAENEEIVLSSWSLCDGSGNVLNPSVSLDYELQDSDPAEIVLLPNHETLAQGTVYLYADYTDDYSEADLVNSFTVLDGGTLNISPDVWEEESLGNLAYGYYTIPERQGYSLIGWVSEPDEDGNVLAVDADFDITYEDLEGGELKLYADWGDDAMWAINYHANRNQLDTEIADDLTDAEGDVVLIGQNEFENPGYTFEGWNTAPDGSGLAIAADSTQTLEQLGLMSRDEFHEKLGTLDESDEATAEEYTDQATLDLYAQWKPTTKATSSKTPKTGDALPGWLPSMLIAFALGSAMMALYSMRRERMEDER